MAKKEKMRPIPIPATKAEIRALRKRAKDEGEKLTAWGRKQLGMNPPSPRGWKPGRPRKPKPEK